MPIEAEGASAIWRRSWKDPRTKKWMREYRVYPPSRAPFLPGLRALARLVAMVPHTRLGPIDRCGEHDAFMIVTRSTIFLTRANPVQRGAARAFLAQLAKISFPGPYAPPLARKACSTFMNECGFCAVNWDGKSVTATDEGGGKHRFTGTTRGLYGRQASILFRACQEFQPFYLEAAHL